MRLTVRTRLLFIWHLWTSLGIQILSANYTSSPESVTADYIQQGFSDTNNSQTEMSAESKPDQNSSDENIVKQSWQSTFKLKLPRKPSVDNPIVNDTEDDNEEPLIFTDTIVLSQGQSAPEIPPLRRSIAACNTFCKDGKRVKETPSCYYPVSCSTCNCDPLCAEYGDCCPDEDGSLPEDSLSIYACIGKDMFSTGVGYYMIRTCPISAESRSTDWIDVLHPVTSNVTGNVYLNEHYAECNNDTEVLSWTNETVCHQSLTEDNTSTDSPLTWQEKNCTYVFVPRLGARDCSWQRSIDDTDTVARCNISGKANYENESLEELCESTYYPVSSSGVVYKNPHCFFCNHEKYGKSSCNLNVQNSDIIVSFAEVMNFIVDDTEERCSENEWFDPKAEICRSVGCLEGRYLQNEECLLSDYAIFESEYTVALMLQLPEFPNSLVSWEDIVTLVSDSVHGMMVNFDPLVYYFTIEDLRSRKANQLQHTTRVGIIITFCSLSTETRRDYENKILTMIWEDWKGEYNGVPVSLNPEIYDHDMQTVRRGYFTYDPFVKTVYTGNEYSKWKLQLSGIIDEFPQYPRNFVPLTNAPTCPFVTINQREYQLHTNGSVNIFKSNLTIPKGNYSVHLKDVQVCLETVKSLIALQNITYEEGPIEGPPTLEGYISLVCTCTSMICIVLTLLNFFRFPVLRSLANKNTMALCISLLFAQGSSQFGLLQTYNQLVCKALGVAIHFFWLTVILWMNVCSFHMFRVFILAAKAAQIQGSHWKILLKYSVFVYTLALVIVSSTIGANYAVSNGTDIGYGKRVCYISDALVVALAFVLPLCLVLVLNAIFFSITVYTIYRTSKVNKASANDRSNIIVYIKLSTLTGLFWILFLISEPTKSQVLKYIAVVLNGCQGVFIFISYVLNRRVFRLWYRSSPQKKYTASQTFSQISSIKAHGKHDDDVA